MFTDPDTPVTGRPHTPDLGALMPKIEQVFARQWLSNNGPELQALESMFASLTHSKHCIAVANATLGLLVTLKALDIQPEGQKVLLPAFTFPATATILPWMGLEPLFVDVDLETHTLSPDTIRPHLSEVGAILHVNTWGNLKHTAAIEALAESHAIPLVCDSAHAVACALDGRFAGAFGRAEVFSLHATKFVHGLEGGLITTDDAQLAKKIRALINFGQVNQELRWCGINAKMNEVSACVAAHNLSHHQELVAHNRELYAAYKKGLKGVPGLKFYPHQRGSNYQYMVLEVFEHYGHSAEQLQQQLARANIHARRYFSPLHLSPAFSKSKSKLVLPHTEALGERVLILPGGGAMSGRQVQNITQKIVELCQAETRAMPSA